MVKIDSFLTKISWFNVYRVNEKPGESLCQINSANGLKSDMLNYFFFWVPCEVDGSLWSSSSSACSSSSASAAKRFAFATSTGIPAGALSLSWASKCFRCLSLRTRSADRSPSSWSIRRQAMAVRPKTRRNCALSSVRFFSFLKMKLKTCAEKQITIKVNANLWS